MEQSGLNERSMTAGSAAAKDPVCGMEVNKEKAPAVSFYLGQALYFCRPSCQRLFRGNPEKYMKGKGHQMSGHAGGHYHM